MNTYHTITTASRFAFISFLTLIFILIGVVSPPPVSARAFCQCPSDDHGYSGDEDSVIRIAEMNNGIPIYWGNVSVGGAAECTSPPNQEGSTTHGSCPLQSGLRVEVIDDCLPPTDYFVDRVEDWGGFIPRAGELSCDYNNVSIQLKNIPPGYVCDYLSVGGVGNIPVDANCRATPPDGWGSNWLTFWIKAGNPLGYHDTASCTNTTGWTCDPDGFNQTLNVDLYADGDRTTGTLLGTYSANVVREAGVAAMCGGVAAHGFNIPIPASLQDGNAHNLYAYGKNIGPGTDTLLTNSPRQIQCCPPLNAPTISHSCAGSQATITWNNVPNATYYRPRIDINAPSWNAATCSAGSTDNICYDTAGTSAAARTRVVETNGNPVTAWVHSASSCNPWGPAASYSFTCGATAPLPVVDTIPVCLYAPSNANAATISWTNGSNPVTWLDIDGDGNWGNGFSNKNVTGTTSTPVPNGFSGGLQIVPGNTYYVRTWNGIAHSPTVSFTIPHCPNCTGISGPSTLTVGQTGTYSANFSSPNGQLAGEVFHGYLNRIAFNNFPGTNGSTSGAWTPNTAGNHLVCCRAWYDGIAECRPPGLVNASSQVACQGPNYCMNVTVNAPAPTSEIHGVKLLMPGGLSIAPGTTQTITLDGTSSTTTNPYVFANITPGNHLVSTSLPGPNWQAAYTWCVNNDTCHDAQTKTFGTSATFNAPAGGFVSVGWYYYIDKPWYKLKDASFYKQGDLTSQIPVPAAPFDSGDTGESLLVIDNTNPDSRTGVVTSSGFINIGPFIPSTNVTTSQWRLENYTRPTSYLASPTALQSFIEYVRAQKKFKIITAINQMDPDTINIYIGDLDITWPQPNNLPDNAVLLVDGNITLVDPPGNARHTFNTANRSVALISTTNILVHPDYYQINGIFIAAGTMAAGAGPNELKVLGNLITGDPVVGTTDRERSDHTRPSFYIEFEPHMYLDLLPHLSTIERHGTQLE